MPGPLQAVGQAHKFIRAKTQKETVDLAYFDNVISATRPRDFIKKLGGMIVYYHDIVPDHVVVSKLSVIGLFCFILWILAYLYCSYNVLVENQSVIRTNFDTRLKQYGDYFEDFIAKTYMLYLLWKVPFNIGRETEHIQLIVDVDLALYTHLNVQMDYDILGVYALGITMAQVVFAIVQTISLLATQGGLTAKTPLSLMFTIIYKDVMALSLTCHYFYYLLLLRQRFIIVIDTLKAMRDDPTAAKNTKAATKTSEMLRGCAILYSMLSKGISFTNKLFGMGMVLTMFVCLCTIILDLFYFMEAHAAQLLRKNPSRYIYLMVYLFWEILTAILIIFFNVYSCERTARVAQKAPHALHELINRDLSPSINTVGMQFSQQLLHQMPLFSAGGLYWINYGVLLQGARFVSTFIVILLQFVSS